MAHQFDLFRPSSRPWNSGRIIGAKPPLKPKQVWGIRQQLRTASRVRDLALFNCALDSKLRGCDLVKLRVSDVAPGGSLRQRATVVSRRRDVQFRLRSPTRRGTHWPRGSIAADKGTMIGCSQVGLDAEATSALVNMPGLSINGSH
jgi:hypothetical protein